MEIPSIVIDLVAFVSIFGISIIMLKGHYEKKLSTFGTEQNTTGVRKRAVKGQEDAVEVMKELTTDSIVFLKDEIKDLRNTIKRLKASVSWYKGQMYGDSHIDDKDEAGIPNPSSRMQKRYDVNEDILNMRMKMITDKLKIPPELLIFEDVRNIISEIAASPQFDEIAATAMRSGGIKTAESNPETSNVRYV